MVQWQILKEPKKVSTRLDVVEGQVAEVTSSMGKDRSKGHKLSTVCKAKINHVNDSDSDVTSDSSVVSDGEV